MLAHQKAKDLVFVEREAVFSVGVPISFYVVAIYSGGQGAITPAIRARSLHGATLGELGFNGV